MSNCTVEDIRVRGDAVVSADFDAVGEITQNSRSTISAVATAITTVPGGANSLQRVVWDPATVVKTGTDIDIDPDDASKFVVSADGDYVFFATITYEPTDGGYRGLYIRSPAGTGQSNLEAAPVVPTTVAVSHGDFMTAGQEFWVWGVKHSAGSPALDIDPAQGPVRILAYKL